MHINEVENIVGLSKKSIRYYEEMNLIHPIRNKGNDYRIYNEDDIKRLKIIKFLRELDVPIKELKDLNNNDISLEECMENRINKIKDEEEKYKKIKVMCNEIIDSHEEFDSIDITKYFQNIRVLNKEGFTLRNVKSQKNKKIIGAIIPAIIFITFFLFLIIIISVMKYCSSMPALVYIFILFILSVPIISMIYNLVIRIKEILGGEEDEASKY